MVASLQNNHAALDQLREGCTGEIIVPGDRAYDHARTIFNAMIDRRPGVIAQCATVDDVVRAVQFGCELGLEIAVRGGGHSVVGRSLTEGGLVIDLRRMHAISVDPQARTRPWGGRPHEPSRPGHGVLRSSDDRGAGVDHRGGWVHTGGGGGWLDRKFGRACDNLLAVELVTAAGSVFRANEDEHAELFWALHGGGGNFGVATAFTLRLHELSSVAAALLLWRPEAGPDVLRAYRDFMASAPDEVGGGRSF